MKKVLSTIVVALVALSFSAVVFAADATNPYVPAVPSTVTNTAGDVQKNADAAKAKANEAKEAKAKAKAAKEKAKADAKAAKEKAKDDAKAKAKAKANATIDNAVPVVPAIK